MSCGTLEIKGFMKAQTERQPLKLATFVDVTEARNDWLEGALWHRSMVPDRERHRPGAESEIDEVKESKVLVVPGENSHAESQ